MADDKNQTKNDRAGASASDATVNIQSVEDAINEATEKGFIGQVPDETPNREYTIAGVTKARKDGK